MPASHHGWSSPRRCKVRFARLLSLAGLCAAALAGPAYASNYYFSNGGNDTTGDGSIAHPWATFAKLPALAGGDTVNLECGSTWTAQALPMNNSGSAGHIITYQSYPKTGNDNLPMLDAALSSVTPLNIVGKSYITVQDIAISNTSHPNRKNCVVISSGSHDVALLRLDISNSGNVSIECNGSYNITVDGCVVTNSHNNGIHFTGTSVANQGFAGVHDSIIENCTVTGTISNDGITLHDGIDHYGIDIVGSNNQIIGNVSEYNLAEQGFDITSGDHTIVSDNMSSDNYQGGFQIGHTANHVLVRRHLALGESHKKNGILQITAPWVSVEYGVFISTLGQPFLPGSGQYVDYPLLSIDWDGWNIPNQVGTPYANEMADHFSCVNSIFYSNLSPVFNDKGVPADSDTIQIGSDTNNTRFTADNVRFENNIIYNNLTNKNIKIGFHEKDRPPNYSPGGGNSGFLFDHNIYYTKSGSITWYVDTASGQNSYTAPAATGGTALNSFRTAYPGAETSSQFADPLFVTPLQSSDFDAFARPTTYGDLHPNSSSPALNAGVAITNTAGNFDYALSDAHDFAGTTVPTSGTPTIGAYQVTTGGTAPAAPTGIAGSAAGPTTINLSWNDNSGNEDNFIVQRKTTGSFATVKTLPLNSTTWSDTTVSANTSYYYQVQAVNSFGASAFSTMTTPVTTPTSGGTATTFDVNSLTKTSSGDTFNTVSDAGASNGNFLRYNSNAVSDYVSFTVTVPATDTYQVSTRYALANSYGIGQLSVDGTNLGSTQDLYASNGPGIANYLSVNNGSPLSLTAGSHTFKYTVTGKNASASNYSLAWDVITITPTTTGVPSAPTGLTATAIAYNQINLAWTNGSSNNAGLLVERKHGSGGTYGQIASLPANSTTYSDMSCGTGTNYYYRVRAYNASGDSGYSNTPNATTVEISGRVGHWKLDEGTGTSTTDSSGNGNSGTLTNGPTWTTGIVGNAVNFDNVDDVINVGSGSTLDNLSAMTLSAWINPNSMGEGSRGRILQKGVGGNPTLGGYRLLLQADGSIEFTIDYSTGDQTRFCFQNAVPVAQWSHITATWDGTSTAAGMHIYVDGVEVSGYVESDNGVGTRGDDSAANLYIGNTSTGSGTFDGKIDDVRVYNRVLSESEIQSVMQAGVP